LANVVTLTESPVACLTAGDWDTIAALSPDRPLSVEDLARQLQVSRATASRRIMRLRRLGVLREIAVIDLDRVLGLARSILRGSLAPSSEAFADFPDAVRNDSCVVEASILSGRQDFEITTLHSDERAAIEYADDHGDERHCRRARKHADEDVGGTVPLSDHLSSVAWMRSLARAARGDDVSGTERSTLEPSSTP